MRKTLNIHQEGGLGKYLGLPEHFGRKKRDIFASLLDRIRQRAISWTSRFLSGAGKLIMLKSVLTALPTYTMSCFKLPLSLCKQIQSLLTRFWWDLSPEIRKICWISWDRLTRPRSVGGLGFREIEQFNDAMLAKIAWRLIKDPHSLLVQTLFGKYCRYASFLDTVPPRSASHGWRGILAGREVLRKGLGWVVGDGQSINVWSDPWLSLDTPQAPIGPPTEATISLRVKDLLNQQSNDWDISAIRVHLPHYENHIRKLIPPSFPRPDELVWLATTSGDYSTKSGYALAKLHGSNVETNGFNWKARIWQLNTSPKLKQFLLKAMIGTLPVGSQLIRRGMTTAGVCRRCGSPETELQVLLQCPYAAQVWDLLPSNFKPFLLAITSISQLLQASRRMASLPPTGVGDTPLFPWLLWTLWTNRNKLLFEDKDYSVDETVLKIIKDARVWKGAQDSIIKKSNSLVQDGQLVTNSPAPHLENFSGTDDWRLFTDAAWNGLSGNCGLGWHFQPPGGAAPTSFTSNRRFVSSALVAESLAVKAALLSAANQGVQRLKVFSDSKTLISLIIKRESNVTVGNILCDISQLASSFAVISFHFIPRTANSAADALAKLALFELQNLPLIED